MCVVDRYLYLYISRFKNSHYLSASGSACLPTVCASASVFVSVAMSVFVFVSMSEFLYVCLASLA